MPPQNRQKRIIKSGLKTANDSNRKGNAMYFNFIPANTSPRASIMDAPRPLRAVCAWDSERDDCDCSCDRDHDEWEDECDCDCACDNCC